MPTPVRMARAKAAAEAEARLPPSPLPLTFRQTASDRDALPEWVEQLRDAASRRRVLCGAPGGCTRAKVAA
jgi:hypothetical protein